MDNNSYLVLIRHGQSIYNDQNRFTGWKNVDLTNKGISEAHQVYSLINNISFQHAFTSKLKRAQNTLKIILKDLQQQIPIIEDQALNERDYGNLVGQNKQEAIKKYGERQVQIWRRSYDIPPPSGESLKMTADRTIPFFKQNIEPLIIQNKNIIISAHGNSIRSIVMHLHKLSNKEILETEIGWCEPWIYTFRNGIKCDFKIEKRPNTISKSYLPNSIQIIEQ